MTALLYEVIIQKPQSRSQKEIMTEISLKKKAKFGKFKEYAADMHQTL